MVKGESEEGPGFSLNMMSALLLLLLYFVVFTHIKAKTLTYIFSQNIGLRQLFFRKSSVFKNFKIVGFRPQFAP